MEYLRDANETYTVWALHGQEMLWESYVNSEVKQITGISAMPSMHISMAFLFVLVGLRANRVIGILLIVFAVLNMIGCVYLGWHYAIDGYAVIVCTWLLWWAVGRLIKRYGALFSI
jgi:membrane-associated phospholipid phosphatase